MTVNTATNQLSVSSQFLPSSLRALILSSAYWVLSLPLTTVSGSVAAFLGCLLACLLIDARIHRTPLRDMRQSIIAALALALLIFGILLSTLLTGSINLVQLLTPMASYQAGQFVLWFTLSASIAVIMRSLAQRSSYGKVLEILFVASAFVITLAAHRQGMIHRPYFIGDFALIRGIDPSSILMAIGCIAVLALAALMMMESNHRRLPYHFSVLALLCFSLLLYVQFLGMPSPRLTNDLGLTGQSSGGAGTQADNPFRDGENDANDREAPVAIVLFRDDYEPQGGAYYFRESAYSQFNGVMLAPATRSDLDLDLIDHFTSSQISVNDAEIPARDKRKRVRTTIGLLTPHRSPFGLDAPVRFSNAPNPNNLRFKQTYDVESLVPQFDFPDLIGRRPGSSEWSIAQWQEYLTLPDDPRYGELAEQLISDLRPEFADDPYAKALSVKSYLDERGIYSLKNEHAYASDPAASFLFGDLTGYCIHFAYAATYLYRSIGIPARVGIGYSVPSANRAGGSALLVQAVHGHAWPEIYLEDLGWVIVDPSPAQTLVDMSVDQQDSLQQLLADMLRDEGAFNEFLQEQQGNAISLQALLRIAYSLMAALLIAGWLIKLYRLYIPHLAGGGELYRLSYRAALDTLSAHGLRRRYSESREAFARRVKELTPQFSRLTQAHLDAALSGRTATRLQPHAQLAGWQEYSGANTAEPAPETWLALYTDVRTEIRDNHPLWRRTLAFLHPCPWFRTH